VDFIRINVNGIDISAPEGMSILRAVQHADIKYADVDIPTLYYLRDIKEIDDSGVCVVEVAGKQELVQAWSYPICEGMKVLTESERVVTARKGALEKIMSIHDRDCVNCVRTANCELQTLAQKYDIKGEKIVGDEKENIDESSIVIRDSNKCIRCKRCVTVCESVQGIGAISAIGDGLNAKIAPVSEDGLVATDCVNCGQCITTCPVGALYEKDNIRGGSYNHGRSV